jgi:hypothetical protein
MTNRIHHVFGMQLRSTPTQAEYGLSVYPEYCDANTTVRARLIGPNSAYASTVEVAYPFREKSREKSEDGNLFILLNAAIPEPNAWDTSGPYLYRGDAELWQGNECCGRHAFQYGFHTLTLSQRGLHWNDKPLTLRGRSTERLSGAEAGEWRLSGINTLLAPVAAETTSLWDEADRLGFLLIGEAGDLEALKLTHELSPHTSALGWLLPAGWWTEDEWLRSTLSSIYTSNQSPKGASPTGHLQRFIGVELTEAPTELLPKGFAFVACRAEVLPALAGIQLPKLILGGDWNGEEKPAPGILGWIRE